MIELMLPLAVNAEGVHVGQDDIPAAIARKLIGDDKILGVTCSNVTEVQEVVEQGIADYVGLGTVYKTNTKRCNRSLKELVPVVLEECSEFCKTQFEIRR